jgi:CBS domain-containing protein
VVAPGGSLWDVIAKMSGRDAEIALVSSRDGDLSPEDVQGVITRKQVIDTLAADQDLFES